MPRHHPPVGSPCLADAVWEVVAPSLPRRKAQPEAGRPFAEDRASLCGVHFALRTGAPWSVTPRGPGSASPAACWRRLRDRQQAGVYDAAHRAMLDRVGSADKIARERVCLDRPVMPAKWGARGPAATPPTAASPRSSATS
ncbi:MAG: hypothetical protein AVDCRST_MAG19-2078 [uncultured Thermomicrobiales bacterium]|uniref:Insertion element IS402-like domain-containing protein n=1 Tax=uncultured Thermomicrobiales bacterium TaxID=1645740 RepID=A0A6J4V3A0_9BACT|nr:MAG: hypothetical protein AVDCRST_MAG19-2078 [uncultured Thermomicrobiales bacterium]